MSCTYINETQCIEEKYILIYYNRIWILKILYVCTIFFRAFDVPEWIFMKSRLTDQTTRGNCTEAPQKFCWVVGGVPGDLLGLPRAILKIVCIFGWSLESCNYFVHKIPDLLNIVIIVNIVIVISCKLFFWIHGWSLGSPRNFCCIPQECWSIRSEQTGEQINNHGYIIEINHGNGISTK